MILSRNMLMRVGETSFSHSNCPKEPVSYAAAEEDCTGGLIIEVSDDSHKVDADFVLLRGCPQNRIPNSVEGLVEVY